MISFYAEHGREVGSRISTLQYTFPCNMATSRIDESVLYGTGGLYLSSLSILESRTIYVIYNIMV